MLTSTTVLNKKIAPPICKKKPTILEKHGIKREDNYYWLKDRDNLEVVQYLEQENDYFLKVTQGTQKLQEELFHEMKSRIKQEDISTETYEGGFIHYIKTEQNQEHFLVCRKKQSNGSREEVTLNVNELAKQYDYCQLGNYEYSPDQNWLVYSIDTKSRRQYSLFLKNLKTYEIVALDIHNSNGEIEWANDNKCFYYITNNTQTLLTEKIWKYNISFHSSQLIYTEKDTSNYLSISKTKDKQYIIINSESMIDNECLLIDLAKNVNTLDVILKREKDVLYYPDSSQNHFFFLTNKGCKNFKLLRCPKNNICWKKMQEWYSGDEDTLLTSVEVMKDWLVIEKRYKAKSFITVLQQSTKKEKEIIFSEEIYHVEGINNIHFDTDEFRYSYTSLTTPPSEFSIHLKTLKKTLLKEKEVVGDFHRDNYETKRFWVHADGADVPVSIVYKKGITLNAQNPLLLYGYGSYGINVEPSFSSYRLSLLDRGVIFALAHIRGGQEMGRKWYEKGKLFHKKNTFNDFIKVAEFLINEKYTSPKHLYALGGSAGGLLIGNVINQRPELFHGVIAAVPFVDVVTTMLDETIPLTTNEYNEWGNPNLKKIHDYMLSYSPYDNVSKQQYPNILITTGFHDSQVQYWEPTKWMAKLREQNTSNENLMLLKTDMKTGHSGASGRFQYLKEIALNYAFIISLEMGNIH